MIENGVDQEAIQNLIKNQQLRIDQPFDIINYSVETKKDGNKKIWTAYIELKKRHCNLIKNSVKNIENQENLNLIKDELDKSRQEIQHLIGKSDVSDEMAIQNRLQKLETEIKTTQIMIEKTELENKTLQEQIQINKNDLQLSENKKDAVKQKIESALEDERRLSDEYETLQTMFSAVQEAYSTSEQERQQLETSLQDRKQQIQKASDEYDAMQLKIKEIEKKKQDCDKKMEYIQTELQKEEQECNKLQNLNNNADIMIQNLQKDYNAKLEKKKMLDKEYDECVQELEQIKREKAQLQSHHAELIKRQEDAKKMQQKIQDAINNLSIEGLTGDIENIKHNLELQQQEITRIQQQIDSASSDPRTQKYFDWKMAILVLQQQRNGDFWDKIKTYGQKLSTDTNILKWNAFWPTIQGTKPREQITNLTSGTDTKSVKNMAIQIISETELPDNIKAMLEQEIKLVVDDKRSASNMPFFDMAMLGIMLQRTTQLFMYLKDKAISETDKYYNIYKGTYDYNKINHYMPWIVAMINQSEWNRVLSKSEIKEMKKKSDQELKELKLRQFDAMEKLIIKSIYKFFSKFSFTGKVIYETRQKVIEQSVQDCKNMKLMIQHAK